jgi:hypothetical protein
MKIRGRCITNKRLTSDEMYFPITPVSLTPKNNRYNLMEVFVLIEVVLSTNHHDVNNKATKKNS